MKARRRLLPWRSRSRRWMAGFAALAVLLLAAAVLATGARGASLALALERLGKRDWSLYDGSWAEWGSYPDLKIATGDA